MDTLGIEGPIGDGHQPADRSDGDSRHSECESDGTARKGERGKNGDEASGQRRSKPRGREPFTLSRDSILAMIKNTAVLVATGQWTPAQGNAELAILKTLLNETRPDTTRAGARVVDKPRLRDMLRKNPDLLHAIEPLLSDAELRELMDDDDEDQAKD